MLTVKFKNQLRLIRYVHNLDAKDVANYLGVTVEKLYLMERGLAPLDTNKLIEGYDPKEMNLIHEGINLTKGMSVEELASILKLSKKMCPMRIENPLLYMDIRELSKVLIYDRKQPI